MRDSAEPVLHLVHPRPVSWTSIFQTVSQTLEVPLVPYSEWFAKLEKSLEDKSVSEVDQMRRNPALRLLEFFRKGLTDDPRTEFPGIVKLEIDKALRVSPTFQGSPQLGASDVNLWLAFWKKTGFLP